jgi:hypothetical protein
VVAYRVFGGAETQPVAASVLVRAALENAESAVSQLSAAIARGDQEREREEVARRARRAADGGNHQLQRVDRGELDDDTGTALTLLLAAVEEVAWAARLWQEGRDEALGMQHAVADLVSDARRCIDDARHRLSA